MPEGEKSNNWGRIANKRPLSDIRKRSGTTHDDGRFAKIDMSLPENSVTRADLKKIISCYPIAGPHNRIKLAEIIGDRKMVCKLAGMKASDIAKLDFSGVDLTYCGLAQIPTWDVFKYDETTKFADVFEPHIVEAAQKKHKIKMQLIPVDPYQTKGIV